MSKTRYIKARVTDKLYAQVEALQRQERRESLSDMARILLEDGIQARTPDARRFEALAREAGQEEG